MVKMDDNVIDLDEFRKGLEPDDKEKIRYIREHTENIEDFFILLAEEAAELSQAACKVVRKKHDYITSVDNVQEALDHVKEELVDVTLVATVMLAFPLPKDIRSYKINRWYERMKKKVESNETL